MKEAKMSINLTPFQWFYRITTSILLLLGMISFFALNVFKIADDSLVGLLFILSTIGLFSLLLSIFWILPAVNFFSLERNSTMGIAIGISFALIFYHIDINTVFFDPIEDFSINARFRLKGVTTEVAKIGEGKNQMNISENIHPAIRIIGIDDPTVDQFQGFPFPWSKYAQLLKALKGSEYSALLFDIFFSDDVKDNGGLYELALEIRDNIVNTMEEGKGVNIPNSRLKKESSYLSDQIKDVGKVVADFRGAMAIEDLRVLDESENIQHRIKQLKRFRIPSKNVVKNEYLDLPEWIGYPIPPIASIGKVASGLAIANIRYEPGRTNLTMPLVVKWRKDLYPTVSLALACQYYGIDVTKDVEVFLGKYIKLKNIPEKNIVIDSFSGRTEDIIKKPNDDREVTIPIDEEGFMKINFVGPAFTFPDESMAEIINNDQEFPGVYKENKAFQNQILLVAMYYATGVAKDVHPSPFGQIAGIEHHANALNTILMQEFMTYLPNWVDFLIYAIFGILLGFIVPRKSIAWALLGAFSISIIFCIITLINFNYFNYVHIFITPYVQTIFITIVITGYRILTEEKNVKYIRSTFSKFVSKDVVNELLKNPENLKLGGEEREISVFFSDIRGFTSISEVLTPTELVELLNDYLSRMTEIILEYRGTIDKYMGDAIMAFWGAPIAEKDHAYLSCLSAIQQLTFLKDLKKKWETEGRPALDIGIGINTGNVTVGNIGSAYRMDYTVMGDSINLGSRLEGTNKVYGTKIIISEYTYKYVSDRVVARELDLIKVKGKNEPVKIYELIGVKDQNDLEKYKVRQS